MANVKKTVEKEVKIEKEIESKVEEQETKIDPKDEIIAELQKQMEQMQKAFIAMQSAKTNENPEDYFDKTYEIGTRFVNGVTVYSPRREVSIDLEFDRLIELDRNELDMLLKSNFVREWLEKDILFFTDKELYAKKRLKPKFDLGDEALVEIFLKEKPTKIQDVINDFTKNLNDDPMVHCLFYRIVELCSNGKLSTMPHENRKQIEKIFNFKIDDAQMLFRGFREIK